MHDTDRMQPEFENLFEMESEDDQEMEYSHGEEEAEGLYEFEGEYEDDSFEMPFDEETELELAMELLEVRGDEELEQFLGKLFRRVKKIVRSPVARTIGRALRRVAKRTLPTLAGAAGGALFGPAGAMAGRSLGGIATKFFEMELEGMSPEDQELEVARRVVRLAGATAQAASRTPRAMPADTAARRALAVAARRHAPGLLRGGSGSRGKSRSRSGRWYRRGGQIVLVGA